MSNIFDKTTDALGSSMDFRLARHNITSANIANAETPGYKAKKVDFEEQLSRAIDLEDFPRMDSSNPNHFPIARGAITRVTPDVYDNPDVNLTNDKNSVDLEREMATLAENSILYKATTELIKKKLGALKYAISEGGR
ncbi:MAG: flagellar basal body rod protein FlgB [Bdellovibrionales bacterium]|nr:flagellar basal body rod protein FlgB [Bdellovibrionales bacterium]